MKLQLYEKWFTTCLINEHQRAGLVLSLTYVVMNKETSSLFARPVYDKSQTKVDLDNLAVDSANAKVKR